MWKKSGRWRRSVVPNKELSAATTAPLYSSHSVEMYHTRYKRQEASGFIWPHDSSRVLVSDGEADKWFWIHVVQAILSTTLAWLAFRRLEKHATANRRLVAWGAGGLANMSEIAMLRQTLDTAVSSPRFVLTNGSIYAGVRPSEALNRVAPDNVAVDDFVYV